MPDDQAARDREITVSRLIAAGRPAVFRAFTEARHLDRWWGPNGFSNTTHSFEFRAGGSWSFTMHGPDGTDYPNHIEWLAVEPPERIELRHGEKPNDPDAFVSTVLFEEAEGGTRVTLRTVFPTREQRDRAVADFHAIEGGQQTLDSLAAYVAAGTSEEERS